MLALRCIIICAALAISLAAQDWQEHSGNQPSWSICGTGYGITNFKFSINPYPVELGRQFSIHMNGSLTKRVNGGSLNATMMWSPKPNMKYTLIKITLNLCDLLRDVTYSCPLNPGNYSLTYHKNVPDVFPKGLYDTRVTATDQNGIELICVKTEIILV